MQDYKDIGELYKSKFEDFTPEVPSHIWKNVDQGIKRLRRKRRLQWSGIAVGTAIAVAVAFYFYSNEKESAATLADTSKMTEQVILNQTQDLPNENFAESKKNEPTNNVHNPKQNKVVLAAGSEDEKNISKQPQEPKTTEQTAFLPADLVPEKIISSEPEKKIESVKQENTVVSKQKTVSPKIENAIVSRDTIICENSMLKLFVINGKNVRWNTGETTSQITIYPLENETYVVSFVNQSGKDTTVEIKVKVVSCIDVEIPNAFTPNGDGLNDEFIVRNHDEISMFEMRIYSLSGKLLYKSNNIRHGWNGIANGKEQPHGLYVYQINYKNVFNQKIEKKGEVLLIRD